MFEKELGDTIIIDL